MISLKSQNWILENIDTVLFDKDGTFIDLHYFWGKITEMRVNEIIKRFHLDQVFFEKLCLILGYDFKSGKMISDGITALYSRVKIIEIFNKKLQELGIESSEEEITEIFDNVSNLFYKDIEKYIRPIDEAISLIKSLRSNGIKTAVITSDSVESTQLTLKIYKWENLFDLIIGRESYLETKESGIPTQKALSILGANSKTTIMIGDSPTDYISAKNAGVERTILVASGQVGSDILKEYSPFVVKSLKELECLKI